jgi:hypothetical protein
VRQNTTELPPFRPNTLALAGRLKDRLKSPCSCLRLKSLPMAVAGVFGLQPTNGGSWKKHV